MSDDHENRREPRGEPAELARREGVPGRSAGENGAEDRLIERPLVRVPLLVLAAFFVLATALPLIREPFWWVRVFDFPRVQLTVIGLVTAGLGAMILRRKTWRDRLVLALIVASAAYQLLRIWPYTPLHGEQSVAAESDPRRGFRLVVTNVLMTNRQSERWLGVVRAAEPDLVVVLEADTWWREAALPLLEELPHAVERPLDNTYGMLLYSRWPLGDVEAREVAEEGIPSLWGSIELPSGESVRYVFIHPRPPRPAEDTELRDAELVLVAREVATYDEPVVVAGDFNDVAWSYTTRLFQELSGLLDPRIGRGFYTTFHADHALLRWPLDQAFHSAELGLVEIRRLGHVGSDHFPILIELAVNGHAEAEQVEPRPEPEDQELAEEILEEASDGDGP